MDLVHELCPVQLLEVTKKSDNLSGWLASIQHLAHIYREMQRCRPGAEDAQQDEDGGQHVPEQQLEGDIQGVGGAVRRVDAEVVTSRLHRRPD